MTVKSFIVQAPDVSYQRIKQNMKRPKSYNIFQKYELNSWCSRSRNRSRNRGRSRGRSGDRKSQSHKNKDSRTMIFDYVLMFCWRCYKTFLSINYRFS